MEKSKEEILCVLESSKEYENVNFLKGQTKEMVFKFADEYATEFAKAFSEWVIKMGWIAYCPDRLKEGIEWEHELDEHSEQIKTTKQLIEIFLETKTPK